MRRLCDLGSHAISRAQSREFTIDEIWDGYLGSILVRAYIYYNGQAFATKCG
jgi:hypothetical protein